MKFTALQALYLCAVWGVTWAGAVGIAFPFLIVLLIPGRQYIMPRLFDGWTLSQLDAAEYEQATAAPDWVRSRVLLQLGCYCCKVGGACMCCAVRESYHETK